MAYAEPVKGMKWASYPLGDITQWYGENEELYTKHLKKNYPTYYKKAGKFVHSGVDIVRPYGEPLFAVDDGEITHVKKDATGYGRHVRLRTRLSKDIDIDWVYGHMSLIHVSVGDKVKAGDLLGTMGNSGFVISGDTPYWGDTQPDDRGTHCHLAPRLIKGDTVQDYYNGAFGRIDPLPLFRKPNLTSSKVLALASKLQDKLLLQLSQFLRLIDM